jgi:8-oxo-dGTP pyrophosphatase MutT (NUDIX family)
MGDQQRQIEALPEAIVALITKGKKVLLIQRGPQVPGSGFWAPPSGKIEPNEDQAAALVREVREEVGLTSSRCRRFGKIRLQAIVTDYIGGWRNGSPETSNSSHERLRTHAGSLWTKCFDLRKHSQKLTFYFN